MLVKRIIRRVPNKSPALAEEVVQEAYTRALKYFAAYKKAENFEKWFNGILRNAVKDCRASENGIDKEYDDNDVITPIFSYYEANEFIRNLDKFSKRDKEILFMFFVHGFTSKDISIYSGLSHTNTRQIIYKFRNQFNGTGKGRD